MVLTSVLRTGAQVVLGYILTYLASRGIGLPLEAQSWVVETLMVGGGIAAYTALVRWLETRHGARWYHKLARFAGRVLMLGITSQPVAYAAPSPSTGRHALKDYPEAVAVLAERTAAGAQPSRPRMASTSTTAVRDFTDDPDGRRPTSDAPLLAHPDDDGPPRPYRSRT